VEDRDMDTRTHFKAGDKVSVKFPTVSGITYGYIRFIETDGTLTVYFPEIESVGTGWKASDFQGAH
jgi:hypothetical protein